MTIVRTMMLVLMCSTALFAQKALYLAEIKKAVEKGWRDYPASVEQWKRTHEPSVLWGYNSPGGPIYLAGTLSFLYEETGERIYADRTAKLLAEYGDLRNVLPKGFEKTRTEYVNGVPAISNFFIMPPYIRAYLRIKDSGVLNAGMKKKIEEDVSKSADFIFHFPEWGTHNRAMLRAECLMYASKAMSNHPSAKKWKQMAETIASDNLKQWEIEDATGYHSVWLMSLYSYAEAANETEFFRSPITKYYLNYFVNLISPNGTVPEFGDSRWWSGVEGLRFVGVFEKGATVYKDPAMKWAARMTLETQKKGRDTLGVGDGYYLSDAYRWTDESVVTQRPTTLSREVLDDMIGKKVVFRNGWDPTSTYLLLNYRDEGDGGWLYREYLRQTISVEEEKMHHGHADENNIGLLMSKGSVLLTDADYRSDLPSGKFGSWRQDYFHNRIVARKNKRDQNQSVMEFVQNSGAYRAVRTTKIDFLNLREVDMSRTRLIDDNLGYQWDRIVTYVKEDDFFIVVDGIKALKSDYFTFTNFWHTNNLLSRGKEYFDVATDSIGSFRFPTQRSLFIHFPETYAKTSGVEPISRNWRTEQAIYQTISSQYKTGDTEVFVTVLIPHDRKENPERYLGKVKLLPVTVPYKAVGLEIDRGGSKSYLGIKIDLESEIARENIRPRYLYSLGKVGYGDFETDAHYFFATVSKNDVSYSASNVLKVLYKGKPLMEALPNMHGLQLDGAPPRTAITKWRHWEDTVPNK